MKSVISVSVNSQNLHIRFLSLFVTKEDFIINDISKVRVKQNKVYKTPLIFIFHRPDKFGDLKSFFLVFKDCGSIVLLYKRNI